MSYVRQVSEDGSKFHLATAKQHSNHDSRVRIGSLAAFLPPTLFYGGVFAIEPFVFCAMLAFPLVACSVLIE